MLLALDDAIIELQLLVQLFCTIIFAIIKVVCNYN